MQRKFADETTIRQLCQGNSMLISLMIRNRAVEEGHFRLASGFHSPYYLNKDAVLGDTSSTFSLCDHLYRLALCQKKIMETRTFIGPARHGVVLAVGLAFAAHQHSGQSLKYLGVFRDRTTGKLTVPDEVRARIESPVWLVDDVVTTLKTLDEVEAALDLPADSVLGRSCLVDRRGENDNEAGGTFVDYLVRARFPIWPANDLLCPGCANGLPLCTHLGHAQPTLLSA